MTAFEPLDAFAARILEVGTAPAIAVAITDSDRTIATRTYGAAAPDALWPIASIGKSFTAVIALQLAEEGRLDLHAPVTDYVPWLTIGSRSAPITPAPPAHAHGRVIVESSDLAPASTYDVIALADTETRLRARRAPLVLEHRLSGRRRRAGGRDRACRTASCCSAACSTGSGCASRSP